MSIPKTLKVFTFFHIFPKPPEAVSQQKETADKGYQIKSVRLID